ncbi:Uncharacterised protein [Mycobacteroides abscessus subsp. abscessus]|nr:Uncharacterised protein [Mycobacteroides abscessus subsp. abscessus]SID38203.1 Uncharacterised protein [Mycobacteroides abscessus subsp. abscessus]
MPGGVREVGDLVRIDRLQRRRTGLQQIVDRLLPCGQCRGQLRGLVQRVLDLRRPPVESAHQLVGLLDDVAEHDAVTAITAGGLSEPVHHVRQVADDTTVDEHGGGGEHTLNRRGRRGVVQIQRAAVLEELATRRRRWGDRHEDIAQRSGRAQLCGGADGQSHTLADTQLNHRDVVHGIHRLDLADIGTTEAHLRLGRQVERVGESRGQFVGLRTHIGGGQRQTVESWWRASRNGQRADRGQRRRPELRNLRPAHHCPILAMPSSM